MNAIAWGPMTLAGIFGIFAFLLYIKHKAPRWTGFLAAAALLFLIAAIPALLAVVHRPVTSGAMIAFVATGVIASVVLFWFIVCKGHHKDTLFKRKDGKGGGSEKAPHHRAMVATAGMMVFLLVLASSWHSIWSTGRGGVSQTFSEISK